MAERSGFSWTTGGLLAGLAGLALAVAPAARAGTSVSYMREGGLATLVLDGDALDLDPDAGELEVDFFVSDPGVWTASGTIFATGGGQIPVETIVTDLVIQNVGGLVMNEAVIVEHFFTSTLTAQPYTAELDGEYDRLQGGPNIGIADLLYLPFVNDQLIGAIDPPAAIDVPPVVPFAGASGPLYPAQPPLSQTLELRFYLDEVGDAIRLPNSASISQVPEPGTPLLAALAWLVAARRARTRQDAPIRGGLPQQAGPGAPT